MPELPTGTVTSLSNSLAVAAAMALAYGDASVVLRLCAADRSLATTWR
jgi:hypothetical protein